MQTIVDEFGDPIGFDASRWIVEWLANPCGARRRHADKLIAYLHTPDDVVPWVIAERLRVLSPIGKLLSLLDPRPSANNGGVD